MLTCDKFPSTSCLFPSLSGYLLLRLSDYVMGFCISIELVFQNLLSSLFIKDILLLLLSYLPLMGKSHVSVQDLYCSSEEDPRPSPLLVPVPAHCVAESMKERLQVMEYGQLLDKSGGPQGRHDSQCAVCLNCLDEKQQVRELKNCTHAFHKECMDRGQGSYPLCRSKLSSDYQGKEMKFGGDLWRRERMIYLFGEDYVMGT